MPKPKISGLSVNTIALEGLITSIMKNLLHPEITWLVLASSPCEKQASKSIDEDLPAERGYLEK